MWKQLLLHHPDSLEARLGYIEAGRAFEEVFKIKSESRYLEDAASMYERYVGAQWTVTGRDPKDTDLTVRAACIRFMLEDERGLKKNLMLLKQWTKRWPQPVTSGQDACAQTGPVPFPDRAPVELSTEEAAPNR